MDMTSRARQFIRDDADEWVSTLSQPEKTKEDDEVKRVTPEDISSWFTSRVRVISKKINVEERATNTRKWLRHCQMSTFLFEDVNQDFQRQKIPFVIIDLEADNIKKAIKDAKWISELDDNWDDEGSLGYTKELLEKVELLLTTWTNKALKDSGKVLSIPDIQPGPDGSIDLHWKKETYELLLTIQNNDQPVYFYGDDYRENVMKGSFSQDAKMPNFLFWLYSVN